MLDKVKVRNAAIWSSIEAVSNALLSILSIVYLARVLHPQDYGQIATAQIIGALLSLLLTLGLTEAYIQRREISDDVKSTVFIGTIFLAVLSLLCSSVIYLFINYFYHNVMLSKVFSFEMINSVLTILSVLPTAILTRELRMSSFTKRTLLSRLIFFIVAIPCALNGMGVWSVVYANFIQILTSTLFLFYAIKRDFPKKLSFDLSIFKGLISFGFYVMIENILWNVMSRVFSILIAAFHGTYSLGVYNMATRITDAIVNILNTVVGRMALPLFSRCQDDNSLIYTAFSKATFLFNAVSMPAFTGMALTCNFWVPFVLGPSWNSSIPIIQIICIMNVFMFSRMFVGTAIKAVGKSKNFMYLSMSAAILSVLTVVLTKNYDLTFTMVSWTTVRILVTISIGVYLMNRIMNFGWKMQFKPILLPLISTITMTIVIYFLEMVGDFNNNNLVDFFIIAIVSVFVYFSLLYLLLKLRGSNE